MSTEEKPMHVWRSMDDKEEADRVCKYLVSQFTAADHWKMRVVSREEVPEALRPTWNRCPFFLVFDSWGKEYTGTHEKMQQAATDFQAGYNLAKADYERRIRDAEEAAHEEARRKWIPKNGGIKQKDLDTLFGPDVGAEVQKAIAVVWEKNHESYWDESHGAKIQNARVLWKRARWDSYPEKSTRDAALENNLRYREEGMRIVEVELWDVEAEGYFTYRFVWKYRNDQVVEE